MGARGESSRVLVLDVLSLAEEPPEWIVEGSLPLSHEVPVSVCDKIVAEGLAERLVVEVAEDENVSIRRELVVERSADPRSPSR